jgi:phospholipid transport system substrate-binding protein
MHRLGLAIPTRLFLAGCFAVSLAMAVLPRLGHAAAAPQDTVRNFYDTLLSAMKTGGTLGMKGRYEQLAPAVRQDFDLLYMARLAVGPRWSELTDDQRKQVAEALARYIAATYADNFDVYHGEIFDVMGEETNPYGTIVTSRIVRSGGEPVAMNYLMRQDDGAWRVGDVYLTGTISQVATLRAQFSPVLARDGADGLIATLNRKAETLVAAVVP